jgi:Spy/CpxP family protein refolding chaperone
MKVMIRALGVVAFAALAASGTAQAQGMWGGMGPGYGPGPMMGSGNGPGMMPGHSYHGDPGMMGWGGPGMMGGGGGPGFMSFGRGMQSALGLSEDQRKKLDAIHDDLETKTWEIMGKMRIEMAKMRELMSADPLDKSALDAAFKRMSDLRLERFDAHITAHQQMLALLTKEQREQLKRYGP